MKSKRGLFSRTGSFRFAIALLTLVAFTAQTIVTQTHIHTAAHARVLTASLANPHAPLPDKSPAGDDSANCPICQVLLHAGVYVASAAVAVPLLTVATVFNAVAFEIVAFAQTHSHAWKSRAPPVA